MKKIILSVIFVLSAVVSAYSFSLNDRYVELNFNMQASASNSSFFLIDLFHEELVIDLPALADAVPNSGFSVNLFAEPSLSLNFDFRKVFVGVACGVEIQSVMTLSKDIFDFISRGNKLNQEFNIDTSFDTDVFLFVDASVGLYVRTVKINLIPCVFFPVLHTEIGDSKIFIKNTEEGSLLFDMHSEINLYSQFDSATLNQMRNADFGGMDVQNYISTVGFDLGSSVEVPIVSGFTAVGYLRVPIVPAKLPKLIKAEIDSSADLNLSEMLNGNDDKEFFSYNYSGFADAAGTKTINRPLKARVGVRWNGFENCINVYSDVGFGIRYPFTNAAKFFLEYYIGLDLSLFNIIGTSIYSQYRDLIFSNHLAFFINTRVFELDFGVSIESPTFVGSFKASGLGVYVGASVGF